MATVPSHHSLQASNGQSVRGQPKIGFGLATTSGEIEQIQDPILFPTLFMLEVSDRGEIYQHKSDLECSPSMILRPGCLLDCICEAWDLWDGPRLFSFPESLWRRRFNQTFSIATSIGSDGVDALPPHSFVGKPESRRGDGIPG